MCEKEIGYKIERLRTLFFSFFMLFNNFIQDLVVGYEERGAAVFIVLKIVYRIS